MPALMRLLKLFVFLSVIDVADGVVVCPSKMSIGQTYYCFSSSQVNRLQLLSGDTVLALGNGVAGNQHLYGLVLPMTLTPGNYTVQASAVDGTTNATVNVMGKSATLLLEADKALYKPGQVVRLRALALHPATLSPSAPRNVSFEVTSPEGFKLIKSTGETDEFGVAEFTFPIAQEPLLGRHVAQVTIPEAGAGAMAEAAFTVDEYVLPRFEVAVTLDQSYLTVGSAMPSTQRVTGKVTANFTFGEPVRGGALSVVLWAPLRSWEVRSNEEAGGTQHKALTSLTGLQLDDEGSASFAAEVSRDAMNAGLPLMVEATVVYAATGERQSGSQQLPVRYQGSDLQVDMELSDGLEVFYPGLPVRLHLRFTKPDGAVPSQQELTGELVLVAYRNTVSYQQRPEALRIPLVSSSFDANGVQVIEIPMEKENVSCCDPMKSRRTWQEHEQACGCCVTFVTFSVERKLPGESYFQQLYSAPEGKSSSACAGRGYSPSGEFLAMDSPVQGADGRWSATLRTTREPRAVSTVVQYMVTQASSLKAAGEVGVSWAAPGTFWEGKMTMDLPASMSGDLQIIALAASTGLPTLAASAKFARPLQLPFNLSCSFSKQEVLPGEDVAVQLEATTSLTARAFIASLDRSAELLGNRAAVSQSSILGALQRAGSAKAPTPVAGKAWRHCARGDDLMVVAQLQDDLQVVRVAAEGGSDDAVFGEALGDNCPRPLYDGTVCSSGGGGGIMVDDGFAVLEMAAAAGPGGAPEARAVDTATQDSTESAGGSPVRSFFPETWLWTHVDLAPGQSAQVSIGNLAVTAPDTITTWSLEAFAVTQEGLSATRAETSLRVFKPFFVEMRLPYAAVRGEELELIIAVFNYVGTGTLNAQLQVTLPAELELVDGSSLIQLSVPENQATRAFLRVRPKALGTWDILCEATVAAQNLRDAMRKPLLVKAEGIPVSISETILVDLTGTATSFQETKTLTLPSSAVEGSARLAVNVVGDLLGPSISGLDRLLRIPTGCGEQNMITLAPNVYVAKYLLATGKLTPELRERVVNNMVVGYGRQLTYRHPDGSFSAFGTSDASGSTWLTAFVLRVFVEVQETMLVAVDSGALRAAAEFLIANQREDGSFRRVGQVIHQEMLGGASGSDLALSAYVTATLAKAASAIDLATLAPALTKAKSFLEQQMPGDRYTALLRAHAMVLAGLWTKEQVATEVLSLSTSSGVYRFWTQSAVNQGSYKTLDIEMTGYGLLALTLAEKLGEAFQAVRWLLERRSATGGFSSTQDTVVALNALATYAISAGQRVDVSLEVHDGKDFRQSVQVTPQNMDVLQTLSPPAPTPGPVPVMVSATGSGMALAMANLEYNVPDTGLTPCYTVEVNWFGGSDADAVQACSTPTTTCGTPHSMAIISVGLFTGYAPSMSSLQALKDAKVIKRFELNDGRVDFYLEELQSAASTCVQFKVTKEYQVWNVQPAASRVYEYYEPQSQGETLVAFTVQEMTSELQNAVGIRNVASGVTFGVPTPTEPTVPANGATMEGIKIAVAFAVAFACLVG